METGEILIKQKEKKYKICNFRLSIDDIKKIDKFGIGKNTSDKLRYIIKKYTGNKINSKTRRSAYKIEKTENIELLNDKFDSFLEQWQNSNKLDFLNQSCLANTIKIRKESKIKNYIEKSDYFISLSILGWKIEKVNLLFIDNNQLKISFIKNNSYIHIVLSEINEELIIETEYFSEKEEELISLLYENLKTYFNSLKNRYESEHQICKTYSNGDYYRAIEYGNIIIAELEYIKELNHSTLITLK